MGCPNTFYKSALNDMCYELISENSILTARKFYDAEHSEEELENKLIELKQNISSNLFYYIAGKCETKKFYEAIGLGGDFANAAAEGLNMFESFILGKENED